MRIQTGSQEHCSVADAVATSRRRAARLPTPPRAGGLRLNFWPTHLSFPMPHAHQGALEVRALLPLRTDPYSAFARKPAVRRLPSPPGAPTKVPRSPRHRCAYGDVAQAGPPPIITVPAVPSRLCAPLFPRARRRSPSAVLAVPLAAGAVQTNPYPA
jgi:hypothetical protein